MYIYSNKVAAAGKNETYFVNIIISQLIMSILKLIKFLPMF